METVLTRASESIVFGLKSIKKSTKVVKKRWRICSGTGDRGFESRRFDQKIRLSLKGSLIFNFRDSNLKVLRRLASIVCYSAVRMRRMTQYTASGMRLQMRSLNSLFLSGTFRKTVINCFSLAYPPLRPERPFSTVFFHCFRYNKFS